jgi:hypothetical protein
MNSYSGVDSYSGKGRDERRDDRRERRENYSLNQICNDFIRGRCFRSSCKFLHPSSGVSTSLDSYIPKYSVQSDSGKSLDSYVPPDSRKASHRGTDIFIEYCKDFLKGRCKLGQDCGYAHVLNAASPHVLPASSHMSIVRCADFNRSYCNREVCKFAHIENWESVLSMERKTSNSTIKDELSESHSDHEHEDKKRKYDDYHSDNHRDSTNSTNSSSSTTTKNSNANAFRALFSLVQDWDEDKIYSIVAAIENEDVYDFGAKRTFK